MAKAPAAPEFAIGSIAYLIEDDTQVKIAAFAAGWYAITDPESGEELPSVRGGKLREPTEEEQAEIDGGDDEQGDDDEQQTEIDGSIPMAALKARRAAGAYRKDEFGSLRCGDLVANVLAGLTVEAVEAVALGLGIDPSKYAALNPGQRRMNCANRMRGKIRRGELLPDALLAEVEEVLKSKPQRLTTEEATAARKAATAAKTAAKTAA
jgi:hypothetical protein